MRETETLPGSGHCTSKVSPVPVCSPAAQEKETLSVAARAVTVVSATTTALRRSGQGSGAAGKSRTMDTLPTGGYMLVLEVAGKD